MPKPQFTCHDCDDTFQPADDTCATGYAILTQLVDADGTHEDKICYECARKRDLTDAAETGKLFAYVESHTDRYRYNTTSRIYNRVAQEVIYAVQTWPGLTLNVGNVHTVNTWRSNFGDVRTAFTCRMLTGPKMADGLRKLETWHGIAYAGDGGYCRLRRAKVQS